MLVFGILINENDELVDDVFLVLVRSHVRSYHFGGIYVWVGIS